MILLNWNSSSLTALASLNSSSWDVASLNRRTSTLPLHCLEFGDFWTRPGESRAGAENEVVIRIFHILRDKTGPIDLGMKNA